MNGEKKILVDFCFLILHFNSLDLTEKCVKSILNMSIPEGNTISIVIVDNASENDSGKLLQDEYDPISNIHVLFNQKNEGFSAGNNIGYTYIKSHMCARFVIAANNDIEFVDKRFLLQIDREYQEKPFWVAGPDIFIRDWSKHQNPEMIVEGYPSKKQLLELKTQWIKIENHFRRKDLFAFKLFIKETKRSSWGVRLYFGIKGKIENNGLFKTRRDDVCLQGACLIFDKRFIETNEFLFRPLTFMYCEEQILCLDCYLKNQNMIYLPQLHVEHLNCGSSYQKSVKFKSFCQKKETQFYNLCCASDVYIDYLDKRISDRR